MTVKKTSAFGKGRKVGDGTPGPGRPKGVPNKDNQLLREMILEALRRNGGVDYLAEQAIKQPKAFLSLLGRVLPLQVTGEAGGAIQISWLKE